MNVGDKVRLTKTVSIRNVADGLLMFEIPSGSHGEIRRISHGDDKLVGVDFADFMIEIAVSTRHLELVK